MKTMAVSLIVAAAVASFIYKGKGKSMEVIESRALEPDSSSATGLESLSCAISKRYKGNSIFHLDVEREISLQLAPHLTL